MRMLVVAVLALIGKFVVGIVLSELVAIIGFLLFDRAVGLRFLPICSAPGCAGAAPMMNAFIQRTCKSSRKLSCRF